jgi:tetratricopeptide (TPR) repeat protein
MTGDALRTHRSPVTGHRSRLSRWAWVLVAVVALVPYSNALPGDFTFDDVYIVRDNPAVQVLPATRLLTYLSQSGEWYRPLTMLTYAANANVGRAALGYHVVNLVLHAAVSVAVFFLALRLLGSQSGALAAALLFAVHPIHTEAVTGIVGRAELLAALGVLIALLAFARALSGSGTRRSLWSVLSLAAFAAALLAKESALTGLGLLAVLHWWIDRRAGPRRRLAALLPYASIVAAYLALRLAVIGALAMPEAPSMLDNPLAHVGAAARIRTAIIILWQYAALLAVPLHLSADYSFNQIPVAHTWGDPRFQLGAALLLAIAVTIAAAARRAPILGVAALFTAIPLALTANVLFPIGTIKAERLLYLSSVGWCLAGGWLAAAVPRRRERLAALALAALVAAGGARTWQRNLDWRNEDTLFAVTMADAPESAKAHYNGAVALQRAGRLDDAMVHYRRALEIFPNCADAALGIGTLYTLRGSDAGAQHWYEEAVRRDPKSAMGNLKLGQLHLRLGEYDTAEAAFLSGLEGEPNNPLLLANLSALRLATGDRWRAREALRQLEVIGTLDPDEHEEVAAARRELEVALR